MAANPNIGDPNYTMSPTISGLTVARVAALHNLIDQLCAGPNPILAILEAYGRYHAGELNGQAYRDLFGMIQYRAPDWTPDETDAVAIIDTPSRDRVGIETDDGVHYFTIDESVFDQVDRADGEQADDPDDEEDGPYVDGVTCVACEELLPAGSVPGTLCDRCQAVRR